MSKDFDVEDALKKYRGGPGAGVKQSVLARFTRTLGTGRRETGRRVGLWRRPVPLYVVAATIVIAAGLAFVAGQLAATGQVPGPPKTPLEAENAATADQLRWEAVADDIL